MNNIKWIFLLCFSVSFLSASLSTSLMLRPLRSIAKQPIYVDGPKWHMSKQGTPTMGGLCFIIASIASLVALSPLVFSSLHNNQIISLLLTFGFAALNSVVGITDDLVKLRRNKNAGLSPIQKILMQLGIIALFLFSRYKLLGDGTSLSLFGFNVELGAFYYALCAFILLGLINCANLTDGIDGLASSVAFAIGIAMFFFFRDSFFGISLIGLILSGMCLAFLLFNIHPAKIFMGDTGSLFIGALISGACFGADMPLLSIPLGSVYVIEGISVILQVAFFKLYGKRIFKMAPYHHHLEKSGFSETKICMIAMIFTLVCCTLVFTVVL